MKSDQPLVLYAATVSPQLSDSGTFVPAEPLYCGQNPFSISYKAQVESRYPNYDRDSFPLPVLSLPHFSFPSGLRMTRVPHPQPSYHASILTAEDGSRRALCVLRWWREVPKEKLEALARDLPTLVTESEEQMTASTSAKMQSRSVLVLSSSQQVNLSMGIGSSSEEFSSLDDPSSLSGSWFDDGDAALDAELLMATRTRTPVRVDVPNFDSPEELVGCDFPRFTHQAQAYLHRMQDALTNSQAVYAPRALVLVCATPYVPVIREWLAELWAAVELQQLSPARVEALIALLIDSTPLPAPSIAVDLPLFPSNPRPLRCCAAPPNAPPMCPADFRTLFCTLSRDSIFQVLTALSTERKVLVHSRQISLLMPVMTSLLALMFPLEWSHVFIPILPRSLLRLLQAPLPFFIGCHSSYIFEFYSQPPTLRSLDQISATEEQPDEPDYEPGLFIHTASGCFVHDDVGTDARVASYQSKAIQFEDRDLVIVDIDRDRVCLHPTATLPEMPQAAAQKLSQQISQCGMEYLPRHPCVAQADSLSGPYWRLRGPDVSLPDERILNAAVTLDNQPVITEPAPNRRRERETEYHSPPSRFSTRLKKDHPGSIAGSQASWSRFGPRSQLSDHAGTGYCNMHGMDYGDTVRQLRAAAQLRISSFLANAEVLSEALFLAEGPGLIQDGLRTIRNEEIPPLADRLKAHQKQNHRATTDFVPAVAPGGVTATVLSQKSMVMSPKAKSDALREGVIYAGAMGPPHLEFVDPGSRPLHREAELGLDVYKSPIPFPASDTTVVSIGSLESALIRATFERFWTTCFKDYEKYITWPTDEQPDPDPIFAVESFIASQPSADRKFFSELLSTQLFQQLIEQRAFSAPVPCAFEAGRIPGLAQQPQAAGRRRSIIQLGQRTNVSPPDGGVSVFDLHRERSTFAMLRFSELMTARQNKGFMSKRQPTVFLTDTTVGLIRFVYRVALNEPTHYLSYSQGFPDSLDFSAENIDYHPLLAPQNPQALLHSFVTIPPVDLHVQSQKRGLRPGVERVSQHSGFKLQYIPPAAMKDIAQQPQSTPSQTSNEPLTPALLAGAVLSSTLASLDPSDTTHKAGPNAVFRSNLVTVPPLAARTLRACNIRGRKERDVAYKGILRLVAIAHGIQDRREYRRIIAATIPIQAVFRGHIARVQVARWNHAAACIQAHVRGKQARIHYRLMLQSAATIVRVAKRYIARRKLHLEIMAIMHLQGVFRGVLQRKNPFPQRDFNLSLRALRIAAVDVWAQDPQLRTLRTRAQLLLASTLSDYSSSCVQSLRVLALWECEINSCQMRIPLQIDELLSGRIVHNQSSRLPPFDSQQVQAADELDRTRFTAALRKRQHGHNKQDAKLIDKLFEEFGIPLKGKKRKQLLVSLLLRPWEKARNQTHDELFYHRLIHEQPEVAAAREREILLTAKLISWAYGDVDDESPL